MRTRRIIDSLLLGFFLCGTFLIPTVAQERVSLDATANELFKAKKWAEAAKSYEEIVQTEPQNARAWFQLAHSRFSLGQYESAIQAWEKNIAITNNAIAMYNVACAYARLNQKEKSLDWLNKAINNNRLPPTINIAADDDLAVLRDEPRFKDLLVTLDKIRRPCMFSPEARQLDFWVGEWNVFNPQGLPAGTSVIEQVANGCAILENWGGGGKSLNFYDSTDRKWYQYWIGSTGVPGRYSGTYKDSALRYEGETITRNDGTKVFNRLTFFNVDANTVRQLAEQSTDGKTWSVLYDFKYVRKK